MTDGYAQDRVARRPARASATPGPCELMARAHDPHGECPGAGRTARTSTFGKAFCMHGVPYDCPACLAATSTSSPPAVGDAVGVESDGDDRHVLSNGVVIYGTREQAERCAAALQSEASKGTDHG